MMWETLGDVEAAALSPVADLLAVGSKGGPIEIWDWRRNERLRTIPTSLHSTLVFSSQGKRLLSIGFGIDVLTDRKNGGAESNVNQWDVDTGERLPPISGARGRLGFRACILRTTGVLAWRSGTK